MKRVRRLIVVGIAGIVVLVVLGVVYIDHLAKVGIERGSTWALGVDTTLDEAGIGIVTGQSELSGPMVANPAGYQGDHFLRLGDGSVRVALGSLTGSTVEIPSITLTGIDLNLEQTLGGANYRVIMDNLGRFESAPAEEKSSGKKFVIREIVLKDVKVHVSAASSIGPGIRATVPIPQVRLTDVGSDSDGGVIMAQLVGELLKAIIAASIENGAGIIPAEMIVGLQTQLAQLKSLADTGAKLAVEVQGQFKSLAATGTRMASEAQGQIKAAESQLRQTGEELKGVGNELKGLGEGLFKKPQPAK